jgi:hypothetical protein
MVRSFARCTLVASPIFCYSSNPSWTTSPIAPFLDIDNPNHIHLHQGLSMTSFPSCTMVVSPISCCYSNPSPTTSPITPFIQVENSNHIHLHQAKLTTSFLQCTLVTSPIFLLLFKSNLDNFSNRHIPGGRPSKSHPPTSSNVNDFISSMHFGNFTNFLLSLKIN